MPVSPPTPSRSAIVTTLRSAGCVFAEDEAQLLVAAAPSPAALADMVGRRVEGLPLEYVIGWADFCGRRISVDEGVFVPRHRTEFLVDLAVAGAGAVTGAVVVDVCCGSGALGAAVFAALGPVELYATDIDAAAVTCARGNLAACGGRVYLGDLFEPLPAALRGGVDVVLANVPYVPTGEIELLPREARMYEARVALDGGPDGLDVARRVAVAAPLWLAPGGRLLVETTERQAPHAVDIFSRNGLLAQAEHSDALDATVVIGTMP